MAAPALFAAGPLPLSLGGRFVGRAAVLAELTRRQTAAGSRPVGLALVAAGGQGKTRVALELMWQQRGLYPGGVFWLDVSAPGRLAAAQHALLMQLRPETPALAVLQAGGVDVAAALAAAARGHMPGQAQLWVLDHLPEPEAGQALPTMAELCPRWGEVAVIVTSRILPGDPELEVMELGPLTDEAGAALLTAGLPAGAMAEAEARAVSAWVGGLPIALELLARSLDLGDLSLAELATLVRGAGVAQALAETQQVLHAAGAAVGMSPIVESLRISYSRLSPEAQGLARRLAQFGPEPLPTALVKALGQHASRLARATLAGRSFVTGISGESFGVMHRVLADFLRGLCGAEEPAEACAALLAALPAELLGEPRQFERLLRLAVHAEALLARGGLGRPGLELGLRVGQLYCNMQRPREAEPILRRVVAQAQASLPADDRVRLVAESNLALALGSLGLVGEARALQEANVRAWEARGADDPEGLTARANLALTLQLLGDVAGAYAEHTKVAQLCELRFGAAHPRTLDAWSALAHAELQRGDAAAAIGLQERALLGLRRLGAAGQASVLKASGSLAQMQQLSGNLPAARATIEATLAEARGLWSAGEPAVLHMQAAYAAILRDLGDVAGARAEFTAVRAGLERALGLADPQTLAVVLGLAQMAQQAGQYAEARALLAEVVARGRPRLGLVHPVLSLALTMLIDVALQQGEVAWALTQLQQAVAELRGLWPSTRPELLGLEQRLGDVLGLVGDPAGARVLLTNVLARWESGAGPRHPGTIAAAASLGLALQRGGALAEARAVQERVLRDSREVFGATAVDTWTAQRQLASTLHMQGEFAEARALLAEVVAGLTQRMGASHPEVLLGRGELGTMALWMGSTAAAEAELVPAIAGLATQLPADHQVLFDLRTTELRLRIAQGRLAEARGLLATLWAQVQGKHGPVSVAAAEFAKNAGDTLLTVGAAAEAALWLRVGLELLMQLQPAERVTLDCAMATATAMVQARGEPARAREVLTRASEQVRQRLGAAHPWVAELAAHAAKLGLLPS